MNICDIVGTNTCRTAILQTFIIFAWNLDSSFQSTAPVISSLAPAAVVNLCHQPHENMWMVPTQNKIHFAVFPKYNAPD
jgi:hypothetical protein